MAYEWIVIYAVIAGQQLLQNVHHLDKPEN